MVLYESSFEDFLRETEKKNIICYGAGMLPLYLEPLFESCRIVQRICCFLDGNQKKEGQKVVLGKRSVPIKKKEALSEWSAKDSVLLITAEKYPEILKSLKRMDHFEEWDCYVWPLLNLSCFRESLRKQEEQSVKLPGGGLHHLSQTENKIPKMIHYTWFGKNKKTLLAKRCIESWKKQCPGFLLQEWNEDNYDVEKNRYMKQAYETGKWAYVSDFARLDILYHYGGVYLDTDVELFKSIENICAGEGFVCAGEWPSPNSGAGIGCVPGNPLIREMMRTREEKPFLDRQGQGDLYTNSNYEMEILLKHGFSMDFSFQYRENFFFYPSDIIAPLSLTGEDSYVTERTVGRHYCNNSWREQTCYA